MKNRKIIGMDSKERRDDSLIEALKAYGDTDFYPYHMPGHKRTMNGEIPKEWVAYDITEIDGFDNLHDASGIIDRMQKKIAKQCHAQESFLLVNGSTCGVLAAISAAVPKGGKILMARNNHKSAYHGVYLRQLEVEYLNPPMMDGFDFFDAITPSQIQKALEEQKGSGKINAVMIVSPTYEGRVSDIKEIADVVHQYGIPLIVDEAHGAHLGFAEGFASNSNQCGADLVIQSVHKTLPSLTQTAVLHANGDLVDRNLIRRFLRIYQTSSPSYLLMASIENAFHLVEIQSEAFFGDLRKRFLDMLEKLSSCRYLRFVDPKDYTGEKIKQDIGKLVIDCSYASINGKQLYDRLRDQYHIQLEMACETYCLAMFTIADDVEAYDRMGKALLEIDASLDPSEDISGSVDEKLGLVDQNLEFLNFFDEVTMTVLKDTQDAQPFWKAWDLETIQVPLSEAKGHVAGEFVSLYPPGSPFLVPGEMIGKEHIDAILSCLSKGLHVQGITE